MDFDELIEKANLDGLKGIVQDMGADEVQAMMVEVTASLTPGTQLKILKAIRDSWSHHGLDLIKAAREEDEDTITTVDGALGVIAQMYQIESITTVATTLSLGVEALERYLSSERTVEGIMGVVECDHKDCRIARECRDKAEEN